MSASPPAGAVDSRALRILAESLAREAGGLAAAGREAAGPGPLRHDTKSTATDPVTEHDRAAETLLVERLSIERPDDAIVGEEGTSRAGTTGLEWHLDPIDGTVSFLYGLPTWCTSVAVVDVTGEVAGAVHAPALGEMYVADRGGGATLNGHPLSASHADDLALALMATGFSYDRAIRQRQAQRLVTVLGATRDVRRSGSAALDLCSVAAGRVDAYFEEALNSWDLAAGSLIAREAGAVTTAHDGSPVRDGQILACAAELHAAMIDLLATAPRVAV